MSIFQVCGQFVFGYLSDQRVPLSVLACLSTVVAALATFTIWSFAESLPVLILFAAVYGFFGPGFTALWGRISTATTDDVTAGPLVFSLLCFQKGVGNVLAGPIGGSLVRGRQSSESLSTPTSYHEIIIFTGACMLASAFVIGLHSSRLLGTLFSQH
ncbi:hypothetical protein MRB53_037918 [Persea americana]|nr:hypothetical protein MRB53_037918 [Persea americana]